ncbi:MAG: twin-arginine translocation signal domain-containing protein, partial [Eggerthella lenta]
MGTARSMDRRSFLKGATVAGAAAAAAGTLGLAGCAPQDKETVAAASGDLVLDAEKFTNAKWNFEIPPEPVDESKIGNTVECEILVIGAGVGGLVTATSAVEEGADVVVIASSDGPV